MELGRDTERLAYFGQRTVGADDQPRRDIDRFPVTCCLQSITREPSNRRPVKVASYLRRNFGACVEVLRGFSVARTRPFDAIERETPAVCTR